jgi:hypothetical protein
MRDPVRAFYYASHFLPTSTLWKSILLFDELHVMDRPSFTFICHGGHFGMMGTASPMRQFDESFRREGFPLYVHEAPGGPISGDLLQQVDADIADQNFLQKFQAGLAHSERFRDLNIAHGNYGGGDTHETISEKLCRIDVSQLADPDAVIGNRAAKPFDVTTPEGRARFFLMHAMECSAVLNYALEVGNENGVIPLSDAKPFSDLVSCKYSRAIKRLNSETDARVPATDISFAILDEVLPTAIVEGLKPSDVLRYRKESANAREAFLEYVIALQARIGSTRVGENYEKSISRMIDAEVRPAAREYRDKLQKIREKLFGTIATDATLAAAGAMAGTAGLEIFGDISWTRLLSLAAVAASTAGGFIGRAAIEGFVESRAAKRECALSYLLNSNVSLWTSQFTESAGLRWLVLLLAGSLPLRPPGLPLRYSAGGRLGLSGLTRG